MVQLSFVCMCYARSSIKQVIRLASSQDIQVQGWLRSVRAQKRYVFATLNDGLGPENLQLVFSSTPETKSLNVNSFVQVSGCLVPTPDRPQPVELQCHSLDLVRPCAEQEYPFPARSRPDWQRARQWCHLRSRVPGAAAVLRARAAVARAVHAHMHQEGYLQVDTPVLTGNDCEGAGEVFSVLAPAVGSSENDPATTTPESTSEDKDSFFGHRVNLTVSGQLHLEAISSGITHVYTLGPAFRAERSRTRRHLAEFHMLEAELAPARHLSDLTPPLEALVCQVARRFLDTCGAELPLILPETWREHEAFLERFSSTPFITMTHSEAVSILASRGDATSPADPEGDLSREHELALLEHTGQTPVFVTEWPAKIKPFYMKQTGDKAAAVDLLVPCIGELAGGSVREDDFSTLHARLQSLNLLPSLDWYADLRKFGGPPTAGYGLGFERLMLLLTGLDNVKDVVPFPRWYQHCQT